MNRGKWLATSVALVCSLLVVVFVYAKGSRGGEVQLGESESDFRRGQVAADTGAFVQQGAPTPTVLPHLRPVSLRTIHPATIGRLVPIIARVEVSSVLPTRYNTADGLPPGGSGYDTPNDRWYASAEVYPVLLEVVEYLRGGTSATGWLSAPSQAFTQGVALDDGRLAVSDELICFFTEVVSSDADDLRFDYLLDEAEELSHDEVEVRVAELTACYEVDGEDTVEMVSGAQFSLSEVLEASEAP